MNQLVLFALQAVMSSEKLILEIFAYSLWKKKNQKQLLEKHEISL